MIWLCGLDGNVLSRRFSPPFYLVISQGKGRRKKGKEKGNGMGKGMEKGKEKRREKGKEMGKGKEIGKEKEMGKEKEKETAAPNSSLLVPVFAVLWINTQLYPRGSSGGSSLPKLQKEQRARGEN